MFNHEIGQNVKTPKNESDFEMEEKGGCCKRHCHTKAVLAYIAILVFILALTGFLVLYYYAKPEVDYDKGSSIYLPDPIESEKPSPSRLHIFHKAAVCSDTPICSAIGKRILHMDGSAVDATIATTLCSGLVNQRSMGIGGGNFMTVYIKDEGRAYSVIAREKAPANATDTVTNEKQYKSGPLASAVPGELMGLWEAYKRWGKLPWEILVRPTLDICNEGFVLNEIMHTVITTFVPMRNLFEGDQNFRQMYMTASGEFHKPGTLVKPSKSICRTYRLILEEGGDSLYNGTLAVDFAEDLQKAGSFITADDLRNYTARIAEPLAIPLNNGDTLYTPPLPSSGALLSFMLNILKGYHFDASSVKTTENKILTYHRIVEAFKYAYAARSKLGDDEFLDLEDLIKNITSPDYGAAIRLRINDTRTSNDTATYGATGYFQPDAGTAHISVIAGNGDAVSITSSINHYFGAGYTTSKTGIVMNNVMDDFSVPGVTNFYGVEPSKANTIAPGKRPFSSMSPSIIVDRNGDVKMVIGASGGTRITTSVAMVLMRKLWFDYTIKDAIDEARIHHQTLPMAVQYEYGVTEDILKGLRAKGHATERFSQNVSAVCALFRNQTAIYANADYRKQGEVEGD